MPKLYCNLEDPNYPYRYCLNLPATIIFSAVFGLTTIVHLAQAIHYGKKFSWVIIMAGLWETGSYVLRTMSAYDINPTKFSLLSKILVQLAPIWINAYIYMIFGRVVYYFVPDKRVGPLSARVLSLIFVLLDIGCFCLQATGATISESDETTPNLVLIGFNAYRGGIVAQEFFIVLFTGLAIRTQIKLTAADALKYRETSWRKALFPIYAALALITVRIIYRLVEFSGNFDSGIVNQEAPLYLLEALPMSLCLILFNVWHPGAVLVGEESEFPKKKKKQSKGPEEIELKGRDVEERSGALSPA